MIARLVLGVIMVASLGSPLIARSGAYPPVDLVATATSASSFRLTWRIRYAPLGFVVLRRPVGADKWSEIARLPAKARSFDSTGVLAGQTFEHCVRALSSTGESACALAGPVATPQVYPGARGRVIAPRSAQYKRDGEGSIARVGARLLYVYGRYEGSGDYGRTALVSRESTDNGLTWSTEKAIIDRPGQFALPSLLSLDNGTLLLSYVEIKDKAAAKRVIIRSADGGANWGDPTDITDGVLPYMTGSHDRMRRLRSGRLIYPIHAILPTGDLGTFVYVSDDRGLSWRRTTASPLRVPEALYPQKFQRGFWEVAVSQLPSGRLLMIGRTGQGRLYRSISNDEGDSWTQPRATNVLAPIAPANIVQLKGGATLLVWEPHVDPTGWNGGERLVLGSLISSDEGDTWSNYRQIEYSGEDWFSYPSLFVDDDGSVNITYYGENDAFGDVSGNGNLMGGSRYLRLPERWFYSTDPEPGCCRLP